MHKFSVIIVSIMLSACASLSNLPEPEKSEYFTTVGGGFTTEISKSITHQYGINLALTKALPENSYAVVEFQNPANKMLPLIVEGPTEEIKASSRSNFGNYLAIKSPVVFGVTQHTNYAITISIYSDSNKKHIITRHEQLVNSEYIEN